MPVLSDFDNQVQGVPKHGTNARDEFSEIHGQTISILIVMY
jgi:hypothetical protein